MVARVKVIHASNDGVFDVPERTPVRGLQASLVDALIDDSYPSRAATVTPPL